MDFAFVARDLRRIDELEAEALACCVFENDWPMLGVAGLVDWRLAGRLSTLAKEGFLTGTADEIVLLPLRPWLPFEKLLVLGLGPRASFGEGAARRATERLVATLDGLQVKRPLVELPGRADESLPAARAVELALEAVAAGETRDAWWLVEDAGGEAAIRQVALQHPRLRTE